MLYQPRDHNQNLPLGDNHTRDQVGLKSYKYVQVLTYLLSCNIPGQTYVYLSYILNVVRDLPDLQAPPQLCSIENKTNSDNIEIDNNNNNNNMNNINKAITIHNDNNNNNNINNNNNKNSNNNNNNKGT